MMTDQEVALQVLSLALTTGGGWLVFKFVPAVRRWFEPVAPLSSRQVFYMSLMLAFVIPGGIYAAVVALNYVPLTLYGVVACVLSGWATSQTIHFEDVRKERAAQKALAEAVLETGAVPAMRPDAP